MNVARLNGNSTELGNFFFCLNPDFLANLAKVAEAIIIVNVCTGVCTLFNNIKQISPTKRNSIRKHLHNNTLHLSTYQYYFKSDFVKHFPRADEAENIILTENTIGSITPRIK